MTFGHPRFWRPAAAPAALERALRRLTTSEQKTPNEGLEPSTIRLRAWRSTDWASPAVSTRKKQCCTYYNAVTLQIKLKCSLPLSSIYYRTSLHLLITLHFIYWLLLYQTAAAVGLITLNSSVNNKWYFHHIQKLYKNYFRSLKLWTSKNTTLSLRKSIQHMVRQGNAAQEIILIHNYYIPYSIYYAVRYVQ